MAQVNETCEFDIYATKVQIFKLINGSEIKMGPLKLTQDQATSLSWLANVDDNTLLKFELKVKPT